MVIFNKMKITAVIAEFNPFHKGHKYILCKAREETDADYIIVLMSGNFVQRGEPAVFDMGVRTDAALRNGADAVFELPPRIALSSAEGFASGAVAILNKLCIDDLVFGSEGGNMAALDPAASVLTEESPEYRAFLKDRLKAGDSFPAAREAAVKACLPHGSGDDPELLNAVLREPNNILALEYLKALNRSASSIKPFAVPRIGDPYHTEGFSDASYSAEAIRERIFSAVGSDPDKLSSAVHRDSLTPFLLYKLLSPALFNSLRRASVPGDLSNRIIRERDFSGSFSEFCSLIKTKNITYTSVSRHLLHLTLDMDYSAKSPDQMRGDIDYLRLLGFRKASAPLFSELKLRMRGITILGNSSDISNYLEKAEDSSFLENHLRIDRSYNILRSYKKRRDKPLPPEIKRQIIIV
ncbi:MAG: nucleotidyltransferase family protein [Lachnospiraceae bacterium]|nr:nucleotidyltransferase family protein [Lachnospiraceae bacterium]